jgi:MoxR-like ATPase
MLSSVYSFLATDGERRNHVLLYGLPACAKTQILLRLIQFLGEGAVMRLDATSTTSAGVYKLFFKEYQDGVPPFAVVEEIEKTTEEALRVWLGVLDDRGELLKVTFRDMLARNVKMLCLATANDKALFDKLMGGTSAKEGALASRFVNQLECQRPDAKVLEMILKRDIDARGGNYDWIKPCLALAKDLETDDPRKVLGFLDGGDRLLTNQYQEDRLKIAKIQ